MKIYKLITIVGLLYFTFIFTACNSNPSTPEKDVVIGANGADSTTQSSRDSVAKGTIVTPSPSAIPAK